MRFNRSRVRYHGMICYKPRSKQMPVRLFLCCAAPCEVAVVLRGWWEVMELVRAADYAARRCALPLLLLRCNDARDALEEACPCKLLCLAAAAWAAAAATRHHHVSAAYGWHMRPGKAGGRRRPAACPTLCKCL